MITRAYFLTFITDDKERIGSVLIISKSIFSDIFGVFNEAKKYIDEKYPDGVAITDFHRVK